MRALKTKRAMMPVAALLAVMCTGLLALSAAAKPVPKTKFWNITGDTVVKLELAPAGTTKWGPDLCKAASDDADDDGVDDDERLVLKNVATGRYDARLTYKDGGVCLAKAIEITDGKVFSIEKNQLTDCTKPR
jgi:hypothetical protein